MFTNHATGEAFVEFGSTKSRDLALLRNKHMLGSRWLAVFTTGLQEVTGAQAQAELVLKAQAEAEASGAKSYILRMRGVPFQATEEDIQKFFLPLACVENGILIPRKRGSNYATGEAFAQFVSDSDLEEAMKKHKEEIMGEFERSNSSSAFDVNSSRALRDLRDDWMPRGSWLWSLTVGLGWLVLVRMNGWIPGWMNADSFANSTLTSSHHFF